MAEKDPAFLFYSKDWIEGTAELLPSEKGVYIDLLCHHHQKGDLPSDINRLARMVGLPLVEFEEIWKALLSKFKDNGSGRLVNMKLSKVTGERTDRAHKNRIIGHFGLLMRQCDLSENDKKKIRSEFKCDEFLPFSTEVATERLTEWFTKRSPFLEDANANEDASTNTEIQLTPKQQEFKDAFDGWLEMRKKIKKPATKRAEELAKTELRKLAGKDIDLAIKIINQSTVGCWTSFYELKAGKQIEGRQPRPI